MSFESFQAEAQELLEEAERVLLDLSERPQEKELLDELFRYIHTLKGAAGIFALEAVVGFAHLFENVLDRCRQGYPVTPEVQELFLDSNDALVGLLEQSVQLHRGDQAVTLGQMPAELRDLVDELTGRLSRHQQDPQDAEPLPEAEEAFEGCFLFDDDEEEDLAPAPDAQEPPTAPMPGAPGEQAAEEAAAPPQAQPEVSAPANAAPGAPAREAAKLTRVNSAHLDKLIDLLAELFTSSTKIRILGGRHSDDELGEAVVQQEKLLEMLHDNALSLRMAEVGGTFTRFRRLVQKLNRELGKDVRLVIEGEDIEMDKTILDKLTEPLTHLLRNSMDHGLEPPQKREQAGKPRQGTICLRARQEYGSVLIEIEDDGRGLNRERILQKARDMGMAPADMTPEHPDVPELIFLPGFSTSEEVSSVSGRGVGMDAVKRNVESLRGRISVRTQDGQGACFTLQLPTNMALVHGFYVRVHQTCLVIPMEQVLYCDELAAAPDQGSLTGYLQHEDQQLSYINLERCLRVSAPSPPRMMVVVRHSGGPVGLLVHAFLGEDQAVVKPMGPMLSDHPFFNGATIQGDNSLAIVMDAPSLVEHTLELRQREAV